MLARLHRSILKALPLPFVAAFSVLLFLLLMQFLIDKLPDLVGRGLPAGAVAELLTYSLAYMVTLAVPMAWLIALLAAVLAARHQRIRQHRQVMIWITFAALIGAGAFTLLPGRLMHAVLFSL